MRHRIGQPEFLHAALPLAQHFARPRSFRSIFGDDKAVIGLAQGLEPRLGGLAQRP
jgi:hypothetical protein